MKEFESYLDVFDNAKKIFSIEFKTIEEMKEKCIYVLDTNVLLLPYTVGAKELSEIQKVYKKLIEENRLFIPAQVAKEFAKNRPKKLDEIYKNISDYLSRVNDFRIPQYPVLGNVQSYTNALNLEKELNQKITNYKKEVKDLLKFIQEINWNDPVSNIYKKLFAEKCIIDFTYDFKELNKELEMRQKYNIPPAYKDKGKEDKGIGDYIIWKSILELSKEKSKDVIFVTGDEKADWFHQSMSKKLYPRYELQYEFYSYTNGNSFNIISLSELVETFSINNEVVDTIRSIEALKRQFNRYLSLRQYAINRANGKCEICGTSGTVGDKSILEIHYIIPISEGGDDTINNVVALCPTCHKKVEIEGFDRELQRKMRMSKFVEGSPCQMSGQICPICNIGILDISHNDSNCVECNKCGARFLPPSY